MSFILSIDQGTSSTKTLIFDHNGNAVAKGTEPLQTNYMADGFVEQDPNGIFLNVLDSVKKCLQDFSEKGFDINAIEAIGISNQRETFVLWDKEGTALYPAIVWQCKRSVQVCEVLKQQGLSDMVNEKTGLIIDPYFSATKLIWLTNQNDQIKSAVANGEAFFGTVDTWLLYKLTHGESYATDHTNASRTLLFNLKTLQWDEELLAAFGLKGLQLPVIKSSAAHFGNSNIHGLLQKALPVTAMIGDSHAAAFGEGCFTRGDAKATLGTGCSILMNIGDVPVSSNNGMVTTICWSMSDRVAYALEGVIVSCGAAIEWLKNELQLFEDSKQTEAMATSLKDNGDVYLIPAFSGLGSPYWQMDSRASITGLSFGSTKNHIVRAALESIAYQVKDVIAAMEQDAHTSLSALMVNGGISQNEFVTQLLANLLKTGVVSKNFPDISALGAALLAGLQAGVYQSLEQINFFNQNRRTLLANAEAEKVQRWYNGWQHAVQSNIASLKK